MKEKDQTASEFEQYLIDSFGITWERSGIMAEFKAAIEKAVEETNAANASLLAAEAARWEGIARYWRDGKYADMSKRAKAIRAENANGLEWAAAELRAFAEGRSAWRSATSYTATWAERCAEQIAADAARKLRENIQLAYGISLPLDELTADLQAAIEKARVGGLNDGYAAGFSAAKAIDRFNQKDSAAHASEGLVGQPRPEYETPILSMATAAQVSEGLPPHSNLPNTQERR